MKNEIQELNQRLTILKRERDNLKSNVSYIENEINSANKESINLYYEFDKQTPRATIP
jgi:RNA binding exosome subunit